MPAPKKLVKQTRMSFSMSPKDQEWFQSQEREIAHLVGFPVGFSFILRLMIKFMVLNKVSLRDYRKILDSPIKTDSNT